MGVGDLDSWRVREGGTPKSLDTQYRYDCLQLAEAVAAEFEDELTDLQDG